MRAAYTLSKGKSNVRQILSSHGLSQTASYINRWVEAPAFARITCLCFSIDKHSMADYIKSRFLRTSSLPERVRWKRHIVIINMFQFGQAYSFRISKIKHFPKHANELRTVHLNSFQNIAERAINSHSFIYKRGENILNQRETLNKRAICISGFFFRKFLLVPLEWNAENGSVINWDWAMEYVDCGEWK